MANSDNVVVRVADLSNMTSSLSRLANSVSQIGSNLNVVNSNIGIVDSKVNQTANELLNLKKQFMLMIEEQRKSAALQRALTEIIRVRQELDQKFGNHQLARDTILGILQANDLELVSKETFSRCSEELMISTPKYWLAPCVVALTAWISNNEELAYKAVREGLRRDAEKTTLLFALICRRVANGCNDALSGRKAAKLDANKKKELEKQRDDAQAACLNWLQNHFSLLQARNMKRSVITLLDAYINHVFAEESDNEQNSLNDRDNLCTDSVANWIREIEIGDLERGEKETDEQFAERCRKASEAYREGQIQRWSSLMQTWCTGIKEQYPTLAATCPEFARIEAYVQRVNAVGDIYRYFSRIINAQVDKKELMAQIDEQLVNLVTMYDEEERELRMEEERMQHIKEFKGDEARADRLMKLLYSNKDAQVDFVDCLTLEAIGKSDVGAVAATDTDSARDSRASVRKCAVMILHDYITAGYERFITECEGAFPKTITVQLGNENWSGTTDGVETTQIHESFKNTINERRQKDLSAVKTGKRTGMMILMIALAVIGVILGVAVEDYGVVLMVIAFVGAVVCLVSFIKACNRIKAEKANINALYDKRLNDGDATITAAIKEWCSITTMIDSFKKKEATQNPATCVVPMIPQLKGGENNG